MASQTTDDVLLSVGEDWDELRQSVARLCDGFPNEYWMGLDQDGSYPHQFVKTLTEAGYLAALIPEAYGGSGLPLRAASVILETIHAQGCNAAACHAQMYTMGTILKYGSPEQKQRYLPDIALGQLRLQAFGVTEPSTGSDTTQLKTRADRQKDGSYLISGQKIWTSRALESDLMLLLARTTPAGQLAKRSDGMSVFLLDMRAAQGVGLEVRKIDAMINHNSCEVFFDNLMIPGEALIGEQDKGFGYIVDSMNAERILIASECIGDARFFIDRAVKYANERQVFGRRIGQNQGIQFPIAQAYAQTEAADLMVRKAATLFDAGHKVVQEANLAKMLAADASWAAAEVCMQVYGGFAFAREYGIERKWREARLYQTAPISKNMILAYLGQHVLGLDRSY
ncbi:MAG: acyl-CoA dehydrogenase family protein [Roseobacter sp.]